MHDFKVGDQVRMDMTSCHTARFSELVTITNIVPESRYPIHFRTFDGKTCKHSEKYFIPVMITNNIQENKPMVSAKEIRDLELNEDDKLLQDAGIEKADGTQTDVADRIVLDKMYKKLRKEMIEDIKKVNAAKEK